VFVVLFLAGLGGLLFLLACLEPPHEGTAPAHQAASPGAAGAVPVASGR
jgi:hypothetical protein